MRPCHPTGRLVRKSNPAKPGTRGQAEPGPFYRAFSVYAQVRHFEFLNFDDPDYVSGNPHVRHGITLGGVRWAFTSGEAANWFPVTRLSHMLDVQLVAAERLAPSHECPDSRARGDDAVCISTACHPRPLAQRVRGVSVCAASAACGIRRMGGRKKGRSF
jgi:hypothetical protein